MAQMVLKLRFHSFAILQCQLEIDADVVLCSVAKQGLLRRQTASHVLAQVLLQCCKIGSWQQVSCTGHNTGIGPIPAQESHKQWIHVDTWFIIPIDYEHSIKELASSKFALTNQYCQWDYALWSVRIWHANFARLSFDLVYNSLHVYLLLLVCTNCSALEWHMQL